MPKHQEIEANFSALLDNCTCGDSPLHNLLRKLFARIAAKLRELGDVTVFVDGELAAVAIEAQPKRILKCLRKDPRKVCLHRVHDCDGTTEELIKGDELKEGDRLVTVACPTFCVNTEGTNHDWNQPTITAEEIARLGGWDPNNGVVLVDANNNERTLKPGEVVELKPGIAFCKKVKFKRGRDREGAR